MRAVPAFLLLMVLTAATARSQTRSTDVSYGAWYGDSIATIWSAGFTSPLVWPFDYGVAVTHLDDHRSPFNRTQTGGELSVGVGRDGSGPYLLAAAGLGMKHSDGNIDAAWSAGGGVALRPLRFLSLAVETRYRAEDQFSRGFWRLDPTDRSGWMVLGKVALVFGGDYRERKTGHRTPVPKAGEPAPRGSEAGRSALASDVVATALDAMGAPYRWGGNGGNGYDCSGLIQFAYAQHGVPLPRISRDQAAAGTLVERDVSRLEPGDILGFSAEGDRVTHVGLYVGKGQFIHSASGGVKLSSLTASDPDSLWWQHRFIVARRILQ